MGAPPIRKKEIETPEELWELFTDYVEYERAHPMKRTDYVGKDGAKVTTDLETPITFEGFECYLWDQDIVQHLGHYADVNNPSYKSYLPIITRVRQNCFTHNFKGASVGLFNANIIARKLGLTERVQEDGTKEVTIKVKYERKGIDDNAESTTPGAIEDITGADTL